MSAVRATLGRIFPIGSSASAAGRWREGALALLVGLFGALALAAAAKAISSPLAAGVAVTGLALTAGMLLSPDFAVLVLALSIPFERIGRLTNDSDAVAVSASRILGIIVLASLMVAVAVFRRKLRFNLPFFLFAGYTGIALVSVSWSNVPIDTRQDAMRILGNLLFFFLLINIVRSYGQARRLALVWIAASLLAAVYSLGDYYFSFGGIVSESQMGLTDTRSATVVSDLSEYRSLGVEVRRLFGPTAHPTLFGLNNVMVLPFLLWAFRTQTSRFRYVWLAGLPLVLYCILLSNTRAVLLAAGCTLGLMFWRRLLPPNPQLLVAGLLVCLALTPFIPRDVWVRTLDVDMYTTSKGDAIRARLKLWGKSWELIQKNWLLGIGVGDRVTLVKMVTDENTGYLSTEGLRASAHNEFIWVWAEVGILGYLLFWGFVASVTIAAFRAGHWYRYDPDGSGEYMLAASCQILMITILLFCLQSEAFHYPLKGWWMAAGISVTLLDAAQRKQQLLQGKASPEQPIK